MKQFSLIQGLQNPSNKPNTGIKYQEYAVKLEDGTSREIGIPLREATAFEQNLSGPDITERQLKDLLREHRGVVLERE